MIMWEINNTVQAVDFLRAIIFGIFICAFYGFFAANRKIGYSTDFLVIIQDIIFLLVISPLIFIFLLATTNGEIRLYVGIGLLLGFYIFKITLFKIYVVVISKFFMLIKFFFNFLYQIFNKIVGFSNLLLKKMVKKLSFFKKAVNSLKKGLKKS